LAYQVREAAKLGTQGSIHRIYVRDPEMKEDLQTFKANNIMTSYKRRIFKPPNNRRLDLRSPNADSSTYQSGFASGKGSNQSFFHNGGEDIGPTLSPKGAPGHTPVEMHHEVPKEGKDLVPQRNIRLVSEGPPQILFSAGRQFGKEDLYQALVDDWWCLLGTIRYYAKLHRLQQSYGLLQKKEMLSRICTPSDNLKKIYDQKMIDMLKNGVITEVPYKDLLWINPTHLVPKASGDMRLVMDMTKVNRFMKRIRFKMEGVSTLSDLISKNDYAISFDLKDAYNHVPVHPSMRPLLGLAWRGKCYTCVGMPFGLNDAPRVFTMIMRVAVRIIREVWNIKTEVYLDDIVLLHQDPGPLKQIGQEVSLFLQWLGWTVNQEKSHLIPSRTFTYLGWKWVS
jgi:hypothetical protein